MLFQHPNTPDGKCHMTDCPVARCHHPAHPGWAICKSCAAALEQALAETPALAEDLDATLARQVGRGTGNGPRSAQHPLPYDPRASEATWILRNTLTAWIRDLEDDVTRHPPDHLPTMARWLMCRIPNLLVHPAAEQAVEELTTAVRNGWNVIDNPTERVFLGRCPGCDAEDVYAALGATNTTCRGCRATHDVEGLRTALRACLDDTLVTATEYAGMLLTLGIPVDRDRTRTLVNVWATRGRITVHPGPAYRFGELQARMGERMRSSR